MKVMVVKSTEREMNAVAMNGENRPLVADEVQGFRKINHPSFERKSKNIPQINTEKPKDVNM